MDHITIFEEKDLPLLFQMAAEKVVETIRSNPTAVILFPTGATPEKMYSDIVGQFKNDPTLDFSKAHFFNLDEYVGLSAEHPLSYRSYMRVWFYEPLSKIDSTRAPQPSHCHIPTAMSGQDPWLTARRYDLELNQAIANNSTKCLDLAVLGVGPAYPDNGQLRGGHIAFNEPGSPPDKGEARVVTLSSKTRQDTQFRFSSLVNLQKEGEIQSSEVFTPNVPEMAITIGIKRILSAKEIIVLAAGESKGPVIDRVFHYPSSSDFPASYLKNHPNIHWIVDEFAGESLKPVEHKTTPMSTVEAHHLSALLQLPKDKKILVVSPHPDDDVISMGSTLVKLLERKNDIKIVYAVTGANSVRTDSAGFTEWYRKLGDMEKAKIQVREEEAATACMRLGIAFEQLLFFRAKYYQRRGIPGVSPLHKTDLQRMIAILEIFQPHHVFFAAENDPNGAHGLATKLVAQSFVQSAKLSALPTEFHGYRGAYNEWNFESLDHFWVVPFDQTLMDLKTSAIKDHVSQLEPLFPSFDPRPFWQRALERNQSSGERFQHVLKRYCGPTDKFASLRYAEVFRNYNQAEFLRIHG